MIGYGVASKTAFAGLAITMVRAPGGGVLKRVRATPVPASTYVLAVWGQFLVLSDRSGVIVGIRALLVSVGLPRPADDAFAGTRGRARVRGEGASGDSHVVDEGSSAVVNAVYLPMGDHSGTFCTPSAYRSSAR